MRGKKERFFSYLWIDLISLNGLIFFLLFSYQGGKGKTLALHLLLLLLSRNRVSLWTQGQEQKNMGCFIYYYQYGIIYGCTGLEPGIVMLQNEWIEASNLQLRYA